MEEIKVTEKFFNGNFIEAVKNGEVTNFKYNVCDVKYLRRGDFSFSFEMNNKYYFMDPEMDPFDARSFIRIFMLTAFKFIHKKPEKLSRLIERFKKDYYLKNLFEKSIDYYSVDSIINNVPFNKFDSYYYDQDLKNVPDEDVTNQFRFTWYYAPDYVLDHGKEPDVDEIDELFKKNGGVRLSVTCDYYNLGGNMFLSNNSYDALNYLVEVELPQIRKIVTETYFEEK